MKQFTLDPIYHRDDYTQVVEKEVMSYLDDVVFDPLEDLLELNDIRLNEEKKREGQSALWHAIMAGIIWYADGMFTGTFSAAISKELRALGAKKVPSGFALDFSYVPLPLRAAINTSTQRSQQVHETLINTLTGIAAFAAEAPSTGIPFAKTVDVIVSDLQEQFTETVSAKEETPPVPELPPGMKDEETRLLEASAALVIREFTLDLVQQLRGKVRENLIAGARTDRLAKIIEAQHGVAQRKARFIAENEVSKLISDFREERYGDLGAELYVWVTQNDERVRDDHWMLEGKTFSWDNPPVTNRATGARNHPGQDYNCRCTARPVLKIA